MTTTSTLTGKNQTTLPKIVVKALGVKPSDQLIYEVQGDRVMLRAKTGRLADLAGKFQHFGKRRKRPVTIGEMKEAIAQAATKAGMSGLSRRP